MNRAGIPEYAELWAISNFSFLRGASHAEELIERAKQLGYVAIAITDECSLAGIVRAHVAAKEAGLKLICGAQFEVECDAPFTFIVLAQNINGYGNLAEFITRLQCSSENRKYRLERGEIDPAALLDCLVLASPCRGSSQGQVTEVAAWLNQYFRSRCWLAVQRLRILSDEMAFHRLRHASRESGVPLVSAGDVHMHVRSRKPLQDVMTAIRVGKPLTECGYDLQPNAERHLRTRLRLAQLYPTEMMEESVRVSNLCTFSLDELRYQYPDEVAPTGQTPASYLRRLTYEGAGRRWPHGIPSNVQELIEHELSLIAELGYEPYFLTVYEIVAFARSRHILCQGRGSAANSVVCYCLHITEVDPARMSVLFERFISRERNEPPDIDVDFEHERREEVIQHIYETYGRDRAALTAAVISYRPRSAIRDVGKALGFSPSIIEMLADGHQWWDGKTLRAEGLEAAGLAMRDLAVRQFMEITHDLIGFPRHLSQHPGGFVLTRGPLCRMVPIENAAMPKRSIVQWDKNDLDALGILKVDVLALGMLTAIRRALDFVGRQKGYIFEMQDIPAEDEPTYLMLSKADSIGVFQVESRAQQSMLPRMKPRCFYDLVIEVAIVRPGPIQGGSVHPYLARRQGKEPVSYPSKELEAVLGRTLGVPIFQEQVMQIAMVAAGFSAGEADGLRRAMAAWKRKGGLDKYQDKLVRGLLARGYDDRFAQQIVSQVEGFSEYGFPESHSASFALLVYASAWLKRHHPAEFLAALLNSQPMGFYTPSQLVQDARRHGVEVRPADVMFSNYDCTLEGLPGPPAVRLGLRMIDKIRVTSIDRIVAARGEQPFENAEDLAIRAGIEQHEMQQLAAADALLSLSGHRRQQVWDATALRSRPQLLREAPVLEDLLELPAAPEGEEIVFDYATLGLTLRRHPLALLRPLLAKRGFMPAEELWKERDGRQVHYCGIVTVRQQPSTANGTIFLSLEDESGTVQVIAWKSLREEQRVVLLNAKLLAVRGRWQREGDVRNLIAAELEDLTPMLGRLARTASSRDFH